MTSPSSSNPLSFVAASSSAALPPLTAQPASRGDRLDAYYREIKAVILSRQNPITGLLPASTAITLHGNYTDAWVRDNVYSILAVWGLALAYRKQDDNQGRTYELEHSVIKLMRGLLFAMMRQAPKVERFKVTQAPLDALHAKYDTSTGNTVVADDQWGHLQIDATSLYLLMLAQMTASGLQIIFTLDEVNFVQNLVYYIGRAYRTPDYGIWERGNKINHGNPELNASSVGMAKAALEAMNGIDLFGVHGSQASVIHVLPDEIARTRITLKSLLPRESSSKEVDAALLSVIGFPAFAVEDPALVARTRSNVVSKLQGKYGCKRFLRDGHQTILEDPHRLHYEPLELKQFEHLECEWPLFFTYLLLDALFQGDKTAVEEYGDRLQFLFVKREGFNLLPELYYVPAEKIDAERENPGSQTRLPNENIPLVWTQSLYLLGQLLQEDLIALGDIDPLGRHLRIRDRQHPLVQIALLSEDESLQTELATYGIVTQTPSQLAPIQAQPASELSVIYSQIGRNDALGLTGRPIRRLRSLTLSRIFRIRSETVVFLPSFLDQQQFYLTLDYHFWVEQIRGELAYIQRHWYQLGRPTMTLLLTQAMFELDRINTIDQSPLLKLLKELQEGICNGVTVKLGRLNQLLLTAGIERIDMVHDFQFSPPVQDVQPRHYWLMFEGDRNFPLSSLQQFQLAYEKDLRILITQLRQSRNLYEQIDLLETLTQLKGLTFDTGIGRSGQKVTVADLLEEVYTRASQIRLWAVIRRAAGLLDKVDFGLSDAVTDILVRGKQISVGKAYTEASLITSAVPTAEVLQKIREFCGNDVRDRPLTQEILMYLSILLKTHPQLFDGLLTLRVGYLILLLTSELARERQVTQDEAHDLLMQLSPFEIKTRLTQVLEGYANLNQNLFRQESLHINQQNIQWVVRSDAAETEPDAEVQTNWLQKRQRDGAINRVPKGFYPNVWNVMQHCKGLVIGDKLDRRNRLDSELLLAEMTPGEKNFALRIEHLLNKIQAPEYHQVNIEALMELAAIAERNPNLQIEEYIVLDVLIGHAVRLAWLDRHPQLTDHYTDYKGAAWRSFYESSPYECASAIAKALQFLTELGQKAS
ncbi:MAG: glycoside hydrolase family 15 protein [Oculatellaceae cyanobacterium Prado106]|jgi:phosphorylase kinase alpha/beta subunit|nr:glycoside hydrolase family 15 protein [Oculatellaceae cyanobacterium Prado106]